MTAQRVWDYQTGAWQDTSVPAFGGYVGSEWAAQTGPTVQSGALYGVAYGLGVFAATQSAADTPSIWTSPEGATWTAHALPAYNSSYPAVEAICYGNGTFVGMCTPIQNAEADWGIAVYSTNGVDWTVGFSDAAVEQSWSGEATGVCYGKGLFVAVFASGASYQPAVLTSADNGQTWDIQTSLTGENWMGVAFGNDTFVAVGQGSVTYKAMTSVNGLDWVGQTAPLACSHICFGNGIFLACNTTGVMTSPDGVTWTQSIITPTEDLLACAFGNGLFVLLESNGGEGTNKGVWLSADGITWYSGTGALADNSWNALGYGNNLLVAVGDAGSGSSPAIVQTSVPNLSPLISTGNTGSSGGQQWCAVVDLSVADGGADAWSAFNGARCEANGTASKLGLAMGISKAGTITKMSWTLASGSSLGSGTLQALVYQNGTVTALGSSTITTTDAGSDVAHPLTVVAGDQVVLWASLSAQTGDGYGYFTIEFTPS